jgi:hypothetical protein
MRLICLSRNRIDGGEGCVNPDGTTDWRCRVVEEVYARRWLGCCGSARMVKLVRMKCIGMDEDMRCCWVAMDCSTVVSTNPKEQGDGSALG